MEGVGQLVKAVVFVCLFVRGFRPIREFFTHMETIADEGPQILTYARHSWPFSTGVLSHAVTFTPTAERLAVELSLPVVTT